jgi:glycosyltransferase involved in cell wall biosynthesis
MRSMADSITILRDTAEAPVGAEAVLAFQDLRRAVARDGLWKWLFRYDNTRMLTYRLRQTSRPFLTALLLRLLSRGPCLLEDETQRSVLVTPWLLGNLLMRMVREYASGRMLIRRVEREVRALRAAGASGPRRLNRSGTPVYLRTDLMLGLKSGGSVGHVEFLPAPLFLTPDPVPTVRADVRTHVIPPGRAFWDFQKLPELAYNRTCTRRAQAILCDQPPAFIYQRYSIDDYSGVALARAYGVPLVLEYNGPKVWVSRHWGSRLPPRHERLVEQIELLNLAAADVVVVVSEALRDELLARGVPERKILVNPNGVDVGRYAPTVQGDAVRARHGLVGKTVVGFIGTFGRWHGAEVLAEAFGMWRQLFPEHGDTVRLLLIGDGVTMPEVRTRLQRWGASEACVCTGLIPQQHGPEHLAACDFFVAPNVPNPDGSEFFGSPTKLFEYMAMGKGIVASDLGQIGRVLRHDDSGWLVKPGDVEDLVQGLQMLTVDEGRRRRLGEMARREAVARYTWREHTRRIVAKIDEVCG